VVLALALTGAWLVPAHNPSWLQRLEWFGGLTVGILFLAFLWNSKSKVIRGSTVGGGLGGALFSLGTSPDSPLTPVGAFAVLSLGGATIFALTAWGIERTRAPADLPDAYRDPEPAPLPSTPVPVADWGKRAAGRFLDTMIILGAAYLLHASVVYLTFFTYFFGLWFLWEVPLMATWGRTPTKMLFRTRVVDEYDASSSLGLRRASARWLLLMLNLPFAFLATRLTGDVLWALKRELSLEKGLAAGTIEVSEAEFRRLREMVPEERTRLLRETAYIIRQTEPEMSRNVAIGATLFLAGCIIVPWIISSV
jgi:uncharacterized RDD family membrane protein YckC